ncbi:L-xylulose reductase [Orchesella cincta]|uniref:L-xylulose reductase n=1 Tax=Orchesella cincta TaxID=48709 RepID=A0A1D2MY48_ORCCI|nr:L-xylulose reductase [Orchesella cincta]
MSGKVDFAGKKCIVTGAGRGIGRAIVTELHARGAKVYAVTKNPVNLQKLVEDCPGVIPVRADLSNAEEIKNVIEPIEAVDVLINNAGVCEPSAVMDISGDSCDRIFSVNLKAVLQISQIVARKMIEKGDGGSILNVSSVSGIQPLPYIGVYACSKTAVNTLTKMFAVELGPHKIRVNAIAPAIVATDMTSMRTYVPDASETDIPPPLQGMLARTPTNTYNMPMSDIVNTALFLVSNQTSQLTGQVLAVDGGYLAH